MSETTTTIRLMKASKEFNVGKNTLVEFLTKAGFTLDNKPDPVLSPEMYSSLIAEYDAERAAKKKSDNVVLTKGLSEEKKLQQKKLEAAEVKPVEKPIEITKNCCS